MKLQSFRLSLALRFVVGMLIVAIAVCAIHQGLEVGEVSAQNLQSSKIDKQNSKGQFALPPLPYAYNALEPFIDEQTMRLHHDKHHLASINTLNAAIAKYPQFQNATVEDLLHDLSKVPEDIRSIVKNHGGSHLNHSMFWEIMAPKAGGEPTGEIAKAIVREFGSFNDFQKQFNEAGLKRFGSGWSWLVRTKDGNLKIISTANQDSPLLDGNYPIMGNDVWEHAYYLKYQNRRADYLNAWWNVVNWDAVNKRYKKSI
ncbi:superoxide dismutase [Pseudanabaena sp. 'Roaring Creek']|uniref:superoxide dismutase n=1 Tax=Pseudanabaena sp. 'Roaring Creek' TaxID=1681830 RepID=UPI00092EBA1B|nr:superoxide dismutase [Pseudanabaena sp. 'Roaring Creek']